MYFKNSSKVNKVTAVALSIAILFLGFFVPTKKARAATMTIRQEINILNGYLGAPSGSTATSDELITIEPDKYTGATYYFEVVASTTSATNATISLKNATTSATIASVTVNGTSYARYRSTSFTPPAYPADYEVVIGSESVGKGAISARVVILQSSDPISVTETQIDIGNRENYTSTATTTFSSPKYWYYDSTRWNGSPSFFVEVTYGSQGISATSTQTYSSAGTYTWTAPSQTTVAEVSAWGGGGAGFTGNTAGGGAGGGGGAYASSTVEVTGGQSYTVVVGSGGSSSGASGSDSTFNSTTVVADGGLGGTNETTAFGAGGTTANSTGTTEFAGGNGGQGANGSGNNDQAGGGGGAGGLNGAGGAGGNADATIGGGGGGGNGGNPGGTPTGGTSTNGGAGGNGGNGGACSNGTSNTKGGGGGGGGDNGLAGCSGGTYGAGGGGGEGGFGSGVSGAVEIRAKFLPATTTITLQESDGTGDGFTGWTDLMPIVPESYVGAGVPTRVRSAYFNPTSGRNYRLVFRNGYSGVTQAIYDAKIVVIQSKGWTASGSYASKSLSAVSQGTSDFGFDISKDGTNAYVTSANNDTIYQYNLSIPWDLSTGVYASKSLLVSAVSLDMEGIILSPDGTKFYIVDSSTNLVYQYNLSVPWDISSGTYASKSVATGATGTSDIFITSDGKRMYIVNSGADTIRQFSISSPWDITTASFVGSVSVSTNDLNPWGVTLSNDGTKAYVMSDSDAIHQYNLSTAWDITTATYSGSSVSTGAQDATGDSIRLSNDGTKAYMFGSTNSTAYQYSLTGSDITKLQPEYMLGNTSFQSGASLQNFLTSFSSSEWNTTNVYVYKVDAANNSSSVVELDTSSGTQITGSSVSSPDNSGSSSNLCAPSDGNLDTKATTNNGDIYGSRILVQVGNSDSCTSQSTPGSRILKMRGNVRLKGKVRLKGSIPSS